MKPPAIIVLFSILVFEFAAVAQEPVAGAPAKKQLKVLVLEGDPRSRGLAHGKAMKEEIQKLLKLWKADLQSSLKMDADEFISSSSRRPTF